MVRIKDPAQDSISCSRMTMSFIVNYDTTYICICNCQLPKIFTTYELDLRKFKYDKVMISGLLTFEDLGGTLSPDGSPAF